MQHAEAKNCLRVLHFGELGVYISEGQIESQHVYQKEDMILAEYRIKKNASE